MKKHILVISQYFYPEQFRINDICQQWIKRGYKVTVITGIPNYPEGKFFKGYNWFKKRRDNYNGINIIRIPIIPRGKNSIMLSLNYISFVISGFFWKLFTRIRADYVFIFEVSPMTQALVGVWYAKKRKIPCYLYVQDLWPENVQIITGMKNKFLLNMIGKMVDYIYSRCSRIFTTSNSFINSINNRGVPIEKIEYWPQYAEEYYIPLSKTNVEEIPNNTFNIVFAGNVGYAQGLDILPKAASIIKNKNLSKEVKFNIVGEGRYKEELINETIKLDVTDFFNFIPQKPSTEIPKILSACNVAFLSLQDNPLFHMTIPAKLQSYMACGMPIIAAATGEIESIIKEANAGFCCQPGDAERLAEIIMEILSLSDEELRQYAFNSRQYYEKHFNKEVLLSRMDKYFNI